MDRKHFTSMLLLVGCLALISCGSPSAANTGAAQPTRTPAHTSQATILQDAAFLPSLAPPPGVPPLPGPGVQLPEILMIGPCDVFAPPSQLLEGTASTLAVAIAAGQVLVGDFTDSQGEVTQQNAPEEQATTLQVKHFIAVAGPATYGANSALENVTYTLAPTAQVGETLAYLVTSNFTPICTPRGKPPTAFDFSLVDLGAQYPYPATFKVCAQACSA